MYTVYTKQYILGGNLTYDNNGSITGGSYLRLTWTLSATGDETIYEANYAWMEEYQNYWFDHVDDYKDDSNNFEVTYFTSRSVSDEIGRVVFVDGFVYLTAILVMALYLAFTLGDFTCIGARPYLAIVTVIVMIMALITSYGIGLLLGFPINTLVFLIPYILLGVGVDDEIIIVEAVDSTEYLNGDQTNGAERFEKALKHSGTSISLTSFCSSMAFIVGATTDVPGIRAFCVFAAIAFFANYGM